MEEPHGPHQGNHDRARHRAHSRPPGLSDTRTDPDHESIALVGIQRRGADLAARLCGLLAARTGRNHPCGELDINLYRDDWTSSTATPNINATRIDFSVEERTIILIDDVLFTGRTIRCALEAILDFGRPGP
jgi:pyrimidine operon attenuation protein / uracil phosphoribosyltransferase